MGRSVQQGFQSHSSFTTKINSRLNASGFGALSCWVKLNTTSSSQNTIWGNLDGSGITTPLFGLYAITNVLRWYTRGTASVVVDLAGITYTVGKWHHLIGSVDSGFLRIFCDGLQTATSAVTLSSGKFMNNLDRAWFAGTLGSLGTAYQLDGSLCDCRIYGRPIFAEEAAAMYGRDRWALWSKQVPTIGKRASAATNRRRRLLLSRAR
jgi:hypothetical protein